MKTTAVNIQEKIMYGLQTEKKKKEHRVIQNVRRIKNSRQKKLVKF